MNLKNKISNFLKKRHTVDLMANYFSNSFLFGSKFILMYLIMNYGSTSDLFGQITILIAATGIIGNLVSIRTNEALVRFYIRENMKPESKGVPQVILMGFVVDVVLATAFLIINLLLAPLIAEHFVKDVSLVTEIRMFSFVAALVFLRGGLPGLLQAKEKFTKFSKLRALEPLIQILGIVYCIMSDVDMGLRELVIIYFIAAFIYVGVLFTSCYSIIKNELIDRFPRVWDRALLKEYLHFAAKTFTSTLIKAGTQNVDEMIVAYFSSTSLVGGYKLLKNFQSPLRFVASPFSLICYPKLVKLFEKGENTRIVKYIFKVNAGIAACWAAYFVLFFFSIDYVISFFDNGAEAVEQFGYLVWIMLITTLIQLMSEWWCRQFANTVDPVYSIHSSLIHLVYTFTITIGSMYYGGVAGFMYALLFLSIVLLVFWLTKLLKLKKEEAAGVCS